jgi:dCTP deaminase
MILSNRLVQEALDSGRLVIFPEPTPRRPNTSDPNAYCPYDTHAVDLTLGYEITVPITGTYAYDLTQTTPLAAFIRRNSISRTLQPGEYFVLERQQFILAQTREKVELPLNHAKNTETCLAARIEGKSSRARIGLLIHFTAPTVHPGFGGTLTLEMINLGPARILLQPEMPIAQLIVEEVQGLPFENYSQFQNQATPAGESTSSPGRTQASSPPTTPRDKTPLAGPDKKE